MQLEYPTDMKIKSLLGLVGVALIGVLSACSSGDPAPAENAVAESTPESNSQSDPVQFGNEIEVAGATVKVTNPKRVKATDEFNPEANVGDELSIIHVKLDTASSSSDTYSSSITVYAGEDGEEVESVCDGAVGTENCGNVGAETPPGIVTTSKFGYKVSVKEELTVIVSVDKKIGPHEFEQVGTATFTGFAK